MWRWKKRWKWYRILISSHIVTWEGAAKSIQIYIKEEKSSMESWREMCTIFNHVCNYVVTDSDACTKEINKFILKLVNITVTWSVNGMLNLKRKRKNCEKLNLFFKSWIIHSQIAFTYINIHQVKKQAEKERKRMNNKEKKFS